LEHHNVTFFGNSSANETDPEYRGAYETAKLLSANGYVIVNGGGPGVMQAATLGAKSVNGRAIGVTFYPKDITHFEGRTLTNPIDEEYVTNNYLERTSKLLELGQIYVVFNGGTGTISEFGMAWGLARLYLGHHKPMILYGDFWQEIIDTFRENMKTRPEEFEVFKIVNSPEKTLAAIRHFEEKFKTLNHPHTKITPETAFEY